MKVVTAEQMVALEQASERAGVSTDTLMENAGLAVAQWARRLMGGAAAKRVLVLVGSGNNGADGLVAARHLARWGAQVSAYVVDHRPDPDPKMVWARAYGVAVTASGEDHGREMLDRQLARCDLVIDAVLGTGRARPLAGPLLDTMSRLGMRSGHRRPALLALDLPTGLNCDTGEVDPACPAADLTVALGRPKIGLLTFPGAAKVGRLEVADIGLPSGLAEEGDIDVEMLTPGWVAAHLPARPPDSHKGTFGHALVVAGSRNYVGAAYLAAQAAVRVGAGLTTLASPHGVYRIAAGKLTEVIHQPMAEDEQGRFHPEASETIRAGLEGYTAMLVGCGLGWSEGTREFLENLLLTEPAPALPTVVDADGLNNLSQIPEWWQRIGGSVALTPHPGEMATLTGTSTPDVQRDRIGAARKWSQRWNVTIALKGANTVVAGPGCPLRISPFSNPGLASGGTGDVLTGIIAGLMAQGLSPNIAVSCGVFLHGQAAEEVRRRMGDTGTIASDLIARLPETIMGLRQQS